jgi:hypothetical protein
VIARRPPTQIGTGSGLFAQQVTHNGGDATALRRARHGYSEVKIRGLDSCDAIITETMRSVQSTSSSMSTTWDVGAPDESNRALSAVLSISLRCCSKSTSVLPQSQAVPPQPRDPRLGKLQLY